MNDHATSASDVPSVRRIAIVSAGLSQPSSTRLLADRLGEATVRALEGRGIRSTIEITELRDVAKDVTNNLVTSFPSPRLAETIERVTTADGLIAVTPIFTASYSGLFKSFFDVIETTSLADMPVLLGATGGTERHSLAIDHAMRPLFAYLHALPVSTGVYAASSDWGSAAAGAEGAGNALASRIERAAAEFAAAVATSTRDTSLRDPFELPAGFSPIGAYGAQ